MESSPLSQLQIKETLSCFFVEKPLMSTFVARVTSSDVHLRRVEARTKGVSLSLTVSPHPTFMDLHLHP